MNRKTSLPFLPNLNKKQGSLHDLRRFQHQRFDAGKKSAYILLFM
jgi:hypothetical protein